MANTRNTHTQKKEKKLSLRLSENQKLYAYLLFVLLFFKNVKYVVLFQLNMKQL